MAKDYLNTAERNQVISALHLINNTKMLVEGNTLTTSEKADLKRAFTYTKKSIESLKRRLNPKARETLSKDAKKSRVYLDVYRATEEYARKKSIEINAAYEENRDYYLLAELLLHYNCNGCTRSCNECEIYHEFEDKCIPELSGYEPKDNCKYAYVREEMSKKKVEE